MLWTNLLIRNSKLIKLFIHDIFFRDRWFEIICHSRSIRIGLLWDLILSFFFNVGIANDHFITRRNNFLDSKEFIRFLWIDVFLKILHVHSLKDDIDFHIFIFGHIDFHTFNTYLKQVWMSYILNAFIDDFSISFIFLLLFCQCFCDCQLEFVKNKNESLISNSFKWII